MRTNDDIEAYLIQLGMPFELIEDGMWVLHDDYENINNIVIYHTPPVVIFRVKLMEAPKDEARRNTLFHRLLDLNANDMIHGAYGLEGDNIVCIDSLQSENLDFNEFQASVEALSMAISSHYAVLKAFRDGEHASGDAPAAEDETATAG